MTTAPPVSAAIHALLAADATLTAMLSQTAGSPSIFRKGEIPTAATYSYVVIGGPVGVPMPERTLDRRRGGRIVTESRGITVFCEAGGDTGPVEQAAWRISELLDYCTLDLTPHRFVRCRASAPAEQPSDQIAYGRRVNLLVRYQEA